MKRLAEAGLLNRDVPNGKRRYRLGEHPTRGML